MNSRQMHFGMFGLSVLSLGGVFLLHLFVFGSSEELVRTYFWAVFAAVAAFVAVRLLSSGSSDTGEEKVGLSDSEFALVKLIFIIPAGVGLILVAAILFLQEPLRQVGWLIIVLGSYAGREIEFLLRTSKMSRRD